MHLNALWGLGPLGLQHLTLFGTNVWIMAPRLRGTFSATLWDALGLWKDPARPTVRPTVRRPTPFEWMQA